LNNLVEQDHRRVKQRSRPMLGFKRQFKTGKLGGRNATMTELWHAALAARAPNS
jgi:transposase-like protein